MTFALSLGMHETQGKSKQCFAADLKLFVLLVKGKEEN